MSSGQQFSVEPQNVMARLLEATDHMILSLDRISASMAKANEWWLEQSYREKAHAYFGRVLRRVNVVSFHEIEDKVEELPPSERDSILLLDLIVRGRPRTVDNPPDVYLAVEVSAVIDRNDVGRALQRAAVLRSLGYIVVPVVAGEKVTKGGLASAQEDAVAVFQDGKYFYWDESLRGALSSA